MTDMLYTDFLSPLGHLEIYSLEDRLYSLRLPETVYSKDSREREACRGENRSTKETAAWLDAYFSGNIPGFIPKLDTSWMSDFQQNVFRQLLKVEFGETVSYKELSLQVEKAFPSQKSSARAVGGALGKNRIALVIPCHRVLLSNGKAGGYMAGTKSKLFLLNHEMHYRTANIC